MDKMLHKAILSLYNQCALDIDPLDDILLCTVETDRFGLPIGVESVRRACEVVDHLAKFVCEYDFDRFVLHFDKVYCVVDGTIRSITDRTIDILAFKDGDGNDVSDGV